MASYKSHIPRTLEINILSEHLLDEVTKDCWLNCLEPLEYFLLPLGITNLCSSSKHNRLVRAWSWFYLLLLPCEAYFVLSPSINTLMQNDIPYMADLLYLIFSDYVLTVLFINLFVRFYFLRKQFLQNLAQSLYDYILENTNSDVLNVDTTADSQTTKANIFTYHTKIRTYCKMLVFVNYGFLVTTLTMWSALIGTFEKRTFLIVIQPLLWDFFIYGNLCLGYTLFLVVLLLLYYRYYVLSAKVYNALLKDKALVGRGRNSNSNQELTEYLGLTNLQTMDTSLIGMKDIKCEYLSLVLLFEKNAAVWNAYALVLGANQVLQVIHGFIFFFGSKAGRAETVNVLSGIFIFVAGVWFITVYIVSIAKLNAISQQFKVMVSMINVSAHDSTWIGIVQFVDTHVCMFQVLRVQITWNLALVLLTTALSPLLSYAMTFIIL